MTAAPDSNAAPGRLASNRLGLGEIVGSTLANIAPATGFFFGFGIIVAGAGVAAPITIVVATLAVMLLANTLAEFSRHWPSTGSFVTFIGLSFGAVAGAAASVFLTVGYVIAAAAIFAMTGGWTQETLRVFTGIDVPWQPITFFAAAACMWIAVRGVDISTRWASLFFYFELALLLVGAAALLFVNRDAISLAPFDPANLSGGLAGIGLGFPLAMYLFIGWENSATLAEETTDPRRNVPRALMIGTVSIGLLYVLLAFATEIGFRNDAEAIGKAPIPFVAALHAAAPPLLIVAYLAGVTSLLSCVIGAVNSQARILFSAGREGLLPAVFGRIHTQHGTPHVAIGAYVAAATGIAFAFGWWAPPIDVYSYTGTLGTIPLIGVYLLTNLALPVFMLRHRREAFRPIRHFGLPAIGSLLIVLPLWGLVQPGQPWPFDVFPAVAGGLLVCACLYGFWRVSRRPEIAARIGTFVADEAS